MKKDLAEIVLADMVPILAQRRNSSPLVIYTVDGFWLHAATDLVWARQRYCPIVRCSLSMACTVGASCSVIHGNKWRNGNHMQLTAWVMGHVGIMQRLSEEKFGAAKSLTECGVAYAFIAIEAMTDAGMAHGHGLPREVAQRLAAATVEGAGKCVSSYQGPPAMLMNRMESSGGAMVAAKAQLYTDSFRMTLGNAVNAAMLLFT